MRPRARTLAVAAFILFATAGVGLAAGIFLLNAPTLTAWGTLPAQAGAALLYLAVALVLASVGKAVLIISRSPSAGNSGAGPEDLIFEEQ